MMTLSALITALHPQTMQTASDERAAERAFLDSAKHQRLIVKGLRRIYS
jgi:hypothetical protein